MGLDCCGPRPQGIAACGTDALEWAIKDYTGPWQDAHYSPHKGMTGIWYCRGLPYEGGMEKAVHEDNALKDLDGVVFTSSWQQFAFCSALEIPFSMGSVIYDPVQPIIVSGDKYHDDLFRIVYATSPKKGLGLLVASFQHLMEQNELGNARLTIMGGNEMYGVAEDPKYAELIHRCKEDKNIEFLGVVDNSTVRSVMAQAHCLAFPCVWHDSCSMQVLEAMSAGMVVVAPRHAGITEIAHQYGILYPWHAEAAKHASIFAANLQSVARMFRTDRPSYQALCMAQKQTTDYAHSVNRWAALWQEYAAFARARV